MANASNPSPRVSLSGHDKAAPPTLGSDLVRAKLSASSYAMDAHRQSANPIKRGVQCLEPKYASFFAQNYGPAAAIAQQYGVDVALPLGLAALESGWGESLKARTQNNVLGMTPQGGRSKGLSYPSIPAAWNGWATNWGPRVQGVGNDPEKFVQQLMQDNRTIAGAIDHRGAYNSENSAWSAEVPRLVTSVRKRLPLWLKNGC